MQIRKLIFIQTSERFPVEYEVYLPDDTLIATIRYRFGILSIDVDINNEHHIFSETIGEELDGDFISFEEEKKWLDFAAYKIISCLDDKTIKKFDI